MPEYVKITIIVLSMQGILMSLILATRKKVVKSANLFLVLFVLCFSLYLLEQILYWTSFFFNYPHLLFVTATIPLVLGPFLFYYLSEKQPSAVLILHLIPFIVLTGLIIPFYSVDATDKLDVFRNKVLSNDGSTTLRFVFSKFTSGIQLVCYFIVNLYVLRQQKSHKNLKWNKRLNYLFGVFILGAIFRSVVLVFFEYSWILMADKFLMAFMCVSILYLFIRIVITSEILKPNVKYVKTSMPLGQIEDHARHLTSLMEDESFYKTKTLRLVDVASRLDITEHQLSQVLSSYFNKNFFEFINSYRVELAKKYLENADYDRFTIEAIGYEVGFKSKSTFNEAFRKFEAVTPSAYKKSLSEVV